MEKRCRDKYCQLSKNIEQSRVDTGWTGLRIDVHRARHSQGKMGIELDRGGLDWIHCAYS